jgi:amidohydrolase
MQFQCNHVSALLTLILSFLIPLTANADMHSANIDAKMIANYVEQDYQNNLKALFKHFHKNPELSLQEHQTAKRMADELSALGYQVTEKVGGTGVVAMLKNGPGPLVMMRADMDGLPVQERSGLDYASTAKQVDLITGNEVPVMHACGHDVHITSLVGTARFMSEHKGHWSGTLMLIVQPAEERILGAKMMMQDKLWQRFGKPDYALAFHVSSGGEEGKVNVVTDSPYAGADTVDIIIHGIGAHGASPHAGKDPIVLGSQIVLALQTLVSRELPPRTPGVVTVGSFHSGTKHNIISDKAHLQLTVRNTSLETRKLLLEGIERIATNLGRAAGLPEDKLPEVIVSEESAPPTVNDPELAKRLRAVWQKQFGLEAVTAYQSKGMGAEDFPFFTTDPKIKSVYFNVGGTDTNLYQAAKRGEANIPSHHSPLFKIKPKPSVITGTNATISALLELMPK